MNSFFLSDWTNNKYLKFNRYLVHHNHKHNILSWTNGTLNLRDMVDHIIEIVFRDIFGLYCCGMSITKINVAMEGIRDYSETFSGVKNRTYLGKTCYVRRTSLVNTRRRQHTIVFSWVELSCKRSRNLYNITCKQT